MGSGDDEGEHTRFPCLGTVRSLVASVVTVLAIAVVVMVILAVQRPEDIMLSIPRGYIQAEPLWYDTVYASNIGKGGRSAGGDDVVKPGPGIGNDHPVPDGLPVRAGDMPEPDDSSYYSYYKPAKGPVTLQVSWTAYNPSGRGKVHCNVNAIRVLVTEDVVMEIGRAEDIFPEKPLRFSVPEKASHTEMQYLTVGDKGVLQHLFDWYGGKSSFMATVQVNVTIASQVQLPSSSSSSSSAGLKSAIRYEYDCGPVAVVHGAPDDTTYAGVTCTAAGQDGRLR